MPSNQWEWFEKSVEEVEWVTYVCVIRIEVSAKSAAVNATLVDCRTPCVDLMPPVARPLQAKAKQSGRLFATSRQGTQCEPW